MAVMVFVHGESYETGTGNAYDGSVLASFGDVIVVTLNYRLGVLGFLSTEDHAAMGNFALLDITQALLWLRENIASFNGDPQKVTLFGHGTGAAIVNLMMLSPFISEGRGNFFQRAIIQSGSALSTWAVSYDPKWCREKIATNVNCSRHLSNNQALIHCLRERNFSELVKAAPEAPKYFSCFAPSIEWAVLPHDVKRLLKERNSKFANVPVIFGITKNEAYAYLKQDEIKKGISDFRKTQIIRSYVQNVFKYDRQKIFEILDHHYTDWTHVSDHISNRDNILELLSDGQYVAPLMEMANYHEQTADTYLYSFGYSTMSESDDAEDVQGIHGDELPYVFGSPLVDGLSPFPSSYTNAERMLSEAVMTYWTNFVKTGNPNQPRNQTSVHGDKVTNRFVDINWPKYMKNTQEYLPIGRRPTVRHHYRAQKLALWLDLIPKINKDNGADRSSHYLDNSNNVSTFDDFPRLILGDVFPSLPPMPPGRPLSPIYIDGTWTTQNSYNNEVTDDNKGDESNGLHKANRQNDQSNNSNIHCHSVKDPKYHETSGYPSNGRKGESTAGVPLSIVIAIGGSLLLINILIFAGLCYQRERIRKMRLNSKQLPPSEIDFEEARFRKMDSNRSSPCLTVGASTGPECMSLMSGTSTHKQSSPVKLHGNSHIHIPSPQPSLHSRRGQSVTRITTPMENVSCNYSPVPTHVISPVHRTHMGVSQSGVPLGHRTDTNFVASKVHAPSDVTHKVADTGGGSGNHVNVIGVVNTFSSREPLTGARVGIPTGSNSGAAASGGSAASGATPGEAGTTNESGEPLYKTINKSGQNNAVTVV